MENQVLHTVWCNISGEAAGDIWNWSLLGVEGLSLQNFPASGFVNVRRILYQNACIAKLKTTQTTLVFLQLNTFTLVDHKRDEKFH